jgi:hypothetical protein
MAPDWIWIVTLGALMGAVGKGIPVRAELAWPR